MPRVRPASGDLLIGVLLSAAAAFLFYRSFFGLAVAAVIIPFTGKMRSDERQKKAGQQTMREFRSAMEVISGALNAGYSMENAWREAEKELTKLYGPSAEMTRAFVRMNQQVRMNEPIETLFLREAAETGQEDICHFAEIFRYAKRNGGNMTAIIQDTLRKISEKIAVLEDIQTAVTAKKTEERILLLLVPGILLFVTLSSPEYVSVLYGTWMGRLLMSVCLAGYLAAAWWGEKIVSIQV